MKKIFLTCTLVLTLFSCVNDSDDFNNDADKSYDVPAETLITNAQRELANQVSTPSVNENTLRFFTQYWAATQYPDESRYWITRRRIGDNIWNNLYREVLGNLESAKGIIREDASRSQGTIDNQIAIIEIQQIYAYQLLVDTFGDIPYSQSLDPQVVLPVYDEDSTIYPALITRLDAALDLLDDSEGSFTTGDIIFGGNVEKWRLFGNSLKVKLGIALADVNASLAQSTIESAVADGVILTNNQNASFQYSSSAPHYSEIYASLVASGRNDYVASESIVNYMNNLTDPRREAYFQQRGGAYVGGSNGAGNNYSLFSPPGEIFENPDFPAILIEAAEINFYLAEAAARGYNVGGSAESYYNDAITQSFDYWNVDGAAAYLADPGVAYASAPGDFKQKIGMQAWVAFFNRPFESWNSFRRLDYPQLTPASTPNPAANGKIPVRITYPINEQTVNNANWTAASTAIGGDKLTSPVFWDVSVN